jgi:hypothetical protein
MNAQHILTRSVVMLGIAGMTAATPAFGGSTEPAVGVFGSFDYVDSATGSDCDLTKGTFFSGHLTWPGAGKAGAVWRYQPNGASGAEVKALTFPKTPPANSTQWAGTVKVLYEPSGITGQATVDGTIAYINADSFVITKLTYTFGNCSETLFSSLVLE